MGRLCALGKACSCVGDPAHDASHGALAQSVRCGKLCRGRARPVRIDDLGALLGRKAPPPALAMPSAAHATRASPRTTMATRPT